MKKLIIPFFVVFQIVIANVLSGQQDTVPNVVIAKGQFERVIVVRIKTGMDLLAGLKKAVEKDSIINAVILAGIGSVTEYNVHSVKTTTFPTENIFLSEKGGFDILNISGYVFNKKVHAHITLSDLKKTIGGHLEPGTTVYTFAIITIGILSKDLKLENFDNWRWR